MDSMRSLNRSLPSSSNATRAAPPEQLLQAFKQAALSVTNLYKSAAIDHENIRQAGYQDALDDLLKFLDKENLGLQDGEGWRIRQWATARHDGSGNTQQSESEDEQADMEQAQRSDSPEKPTDDDDVTPQQSQQEQPSTDSLSTQPQTHDQQPSRPLFQFSAGPDSVMSNGDPSPQPSPVDIRSAPLKVEVINRNKSTHKNNHRHTGHARSISRPSTQPTGSKRKVPFPDFAEIFNVGFEKKDGSDGGNGSAGGGNKRSRLV